MPWLLQNHNSFQSRTDGCIVCQLFNRIVSANRRQSKTDRGLFVSSEALEVTFDERQLFSVGINSANGTVQYTASWCSAVSW